MTTINVEKFPILEKLWKQGIKPHLPATNFESSVISELEDIISKEVILENVSPESRAKIADSARRFKSNVKTMASRSEVCILKFRNNYLL